MYFFIQNSLWNSLPQYMIIANDTERGLDKFKADRSIIVIMAMGYLCFQQENASECQPHGCNGGKEVVPFFSYLQASQRELMSHNGKENTGLDGHLA